MECGTDSLNPRRRCCQDGILRGQQGPLYEQLHQRVERVERVERVLPGGPRHPWSLQLASSAAVLVTWPRVAFCLNKPQSHLRGRGDFQEQRKRGAGPHLGFRKTRLWSPSVCPDTALSFNVCFCRLGLKNRNLPPLLPPTRSHKGRCLAHHSS